MVDNRRVKITKLMLQEALIDLLQEKALENISVRELVNKADINRSTFYSHYDTIYDLLYSITEKYMKKIIFPNKVHDSSLTEHIELLRFMKSHIECSKRNTNQLMKLWFNIAALVLYKLFVYF